MPAEPEAIAKALTVRRARTSDVPQLRRLLDHYVRKGILLGKATVTLYEDIQEFWVAERDDDAQVVGCGALHVMWEDLAEVRTLAVHPHLRVCVGVQTPFHAAATPAAYRRSGLVVKNYRANSRTENTTPAAHGSVETEALNFSLGGGRVGTPLSF